MEKNIEIQENIEQTATPTAQEVVKTEEFGMSFLRILYRHIILILVLFILGGAIGTLYGKLTVKTMYTYTAKYSLLISIEDEDVELKGRLVDYNTTITKMYLPKVMNVFTQSETKSLAKKSGAPELPNSKVTWDDDISIFSVSCTSDNKENARKCLTYLVAAAEKRLDNEAIGVENDDKKIVTADSVEFSPLFNNGEDGYVMTSSYSITKYIIIGFVVGLVAGCLVACAIYLFNNKLKDGRELEYITNTVVLAYIDK